MGVYYWKKQKRPKISRSYNPNLLSYYRHFPKNYIYDNMTSDTSTRRTGDDIGTLLRSGAFSSRLPFHIGLDINDYYYVLQHYDEAYVPHITRDVFMMIIGGPDIEAVMDGPIISEEVN